MQYGNPYFAQPFQQIQPYQDRLAQLQNSYQQAMPYGQAQIQQPIQQMPQVPQIPMLQGQMVDGIDTVKAKDVDMSGNPVYYPKTDGTEIYRKQLQADGRSRIFVYRLINPEEQQQPKVEEKPIEKQPEPFEYERKKEWSMRAQPEKKMEEKPFVYESAPFSGKQNVSIVREDCKQLDFKKEEQQEGVVFRIIGQVFGTYWLVEYEKELLIIDQHAAHEKVLYEKLMKKLKDKKPLTQNLIAPIVVSLSGREIEVLEENAQTLTAIGFCWEMFGDREYLITGVPADFLNLEPKQLFLELLDNLRNQNTKSAPEFVIDHCATMACKAAVKGNHTMSYAEAKELIGQMLQMDQPYHCPHGRPTTIAMSQYEFEKKFKRVL